MKTKLRTYSLIGLPLLFSLLLAACEPTDWDVILAPPEPVTGLSATKVVGQPQFTFEFTLPDFSEQLALFPDYTIMVYYYSRADGSSEKTYHGYLNYGPADFGKIQTETEEITGLSPGIVFILYTVDNEYQRSEPAETGPVTW